MTDQFDDLLTRLRGRLAEAADGSGAADVSAFTLPHVEATASVLDDQISVTMTNNEFTELTIDPRAMRLTNAELAEHLLAAFNAALTQFAATMTETLQAEPEGGIDLSSLQGDLRDIQNQSIAAMQSYTDGLFSALDQARRLERG